MNKGDRWERDFVNLWTDTDWYAQRAGASGGGTDNDLPDVIFANDGVGYAGELKTTSDPHIYITDDEMRALQRYAAAFGLRAVAIGRFKGERAFHLWNPNDMYKTDAGTYRGSPDDGEQQIVIKEPGGSSDGVEPSNVPAPITE